MTSGHNSAPDRESSNPTKEEDDSSPAPQSRRPKAGKLFGRGALLLAATLAAVVGGGVGYLLAISQRSVPETIVAAKWQCPMHPTIVQDHPGECPICGMKLVKVGDGMPNGTKDRKIKFYRSPMDPRQTSPGPRKDEMGMDFVPVYEDESDADAPAIPGLSTVEIEPARQQLIGLKTAPVTFGKVTGSWRTFAKVVADEQRVRHVAVKVPVFVERVYVNFVGRPVRKGEALFSGYSPELLAAQAEYQVALSTQKALGTVDESLLGSGGFLKASRRRLELLDVSAAAIKRLEQGGEPLRTLTFSSPIEGVVTKKDVVDGMKLDAGAMPYEVVDLSKVWVLADIYETDLQRVRLGMVGKLTLKAYPNRVFDGVTTFLDPVLDPLTRTVKARLEFANPSGDLRPGMFGEVTLETPPREGLRIPQDAIIDSGIRKVVFVSLGDGKLQPREVRLGEMDRGQVEVVSGLAEGENVVVRANFLIDSESQLRASLAALMASPRDVPEPPIATGKLAESASQPKEMPTVRSAQTPKPAPHSLHLQAVPTPSASGTASASTSASQSGSNSSPSPAEYTCPMHPEVTDTKPSRCPKCGMTLIPKQTGK